MQSDTPTGEPWRCPSRVKAAHGMPTRIAVEVPGEKADIALTDGASGS